MNNEGLTFWQILIQLMPYISSILAIVCGSGWIVSAVTLKEQKRKAGLDNRDQVIASMENCITSLTQQVNYRDEQLAKKDSEIDSIRTMLQTERTKSEELQGKSTRMAMCMCVHLGCKGRKPEYGQGLKYYEKHKDEDKLGCDYDTLEEIADSIKVKR